MRCSIDDALMSSPRSLALARRRAREALEEVSNVADLAKWCPSATLPPCTSKMWNEVNIVNNSLQIPDSPLEPQIEGITIVPSRPPPRSNEQGLQSSPPSPKRSVKFMNRHLAQSGLPSKNSREIKWALDIFETIPATVGTTPNFFLQQLRSIVKCERRRRSKLFLKRKGFQLNHFAP
jgi:hypothetical protein